LSCLLSSSLDFSFLVILECNSLAPSSDQISDGAALGRLTGLGWGYYVIGGLGFLAFEHLLLCLQLLLHLSLKFIITFLSLRHGERE